MISDYIVVRTFTTSIHIGNKQCLSDRKMNGNHLSKELEIFEAAKEKTKNIKLLL